MSRRNGWIALTFHVLFLIFMIGPIIAVCLVAFTPEGYLSLPTNGVSLRWFRAIAEYPEFLRAAETSVLLGTVSSAVVLVFSVPAALAIARYRFPGRDAFGALFMSPLMIPQAVLGIAFLRFFTEIGLAGTWTGLILAHLIIVMPFALRLTLSSAIGIDQRQEHAAISLGAGNWTVFRRIVWPLILPGVISGWILSFIQSFDEVTMTVFIATPGTETLPVRMFLYIQDSIDPLVASVSACVIALTAVLLAILDRLFGLETLLLGPSPEG
jgi:putative spermidine/putrescine transport system permease protein